MTSQHNVEIYLESLFPNPGTFVEIGCWDGELISQTVMVERYQGWQGLCVDPFPRNFEHRTCKLCSKAVSADGLPRDFVKVSIDRRYGGDVSYFSGFRDSIQVHWPLIEEFCDYEIIPIETITFNNLMQQYSMPNYIDFLSIDTEGSELEILTTIDFQKYCFGLIDFEHNEDKAVKELIQDLLKLHGYVPYVDLRVDSLFISEKLQKK